MRVSSPRAPARRHPMAVLSAVAVFAATMTTTVPARASTDVAATVIGSSSDGSATARNRITLARPAGTEAGHVMVAAVVVNDDDEPSPPPGWATIRRDVIAGTLGQALYAKVATASEPASYEWTTPSFRRIAGGIITYAGVDTAQPVHAHAASIQTSAGTSVTAPSLTTTVAHTRLLHFAAINAEGSLSPPPGMTERWEAASPNPSNDRDALAAASDADQPTAGVTGTRTATASQPGRNIGAAVALTPAGGQSGPDPEPEPDPDPEPPEATISVVGRASDGDRRARKSISISRPAGTREGHVMVASVVASDDFGPDAPPGWTAIRHDTIAGTLGQALYVRVATADEPQSYEWTMPRPLRIAGGIVTYAGADTTAPVHAHAGAIRTAPGTSVTAPSLTTTTAPTRLLHVAAINADSTLEAPPGMTQQWEARSPTNAKSGSAAAAVADAAQPTAGATGTRTATASQPGPSVAVALALAPGSQPEPHPGMLLGLRQQGNNLAELTEIEGILGKDVGLVREFRPRWDRLCAAGDIPGSQCTNNPRVERYMAGGKMVAWSVKPPDWSDGMSPWARAAQDTDMIDRHILDLQYLAGKHDIPYATYTVHHEPHDDASDWINPRCSGTGCSGTVKEFRDLYRVVRSRIDTLGADRVLLAYIGVVSHLTRTAGGGGVGSGDTMYPGDDVVHILGVDPYNWGCFRKDPGTCADDAQPAPNHEWRSFEEAVDHPDSSTSALDLAAARNKKVIITEFGSHPGCDGVTDLFGCNGPHTADPTWDRDRWFRDMARYLTTDPEARRYIVGFSYFHSLQTHDWRFVTHHVDGDPTNPVVEVDERGRAGWTDGFVHDSPYNGHHAGFFRPTARGFTFSLDPSG